MALSIVRSSRLSTERVCANIVPVITNDPAGNYVVSADIMSDGSLVSHASWRQWNHDTHSNV